MHSLISNLAVCANKSNIMHKHAAVILKSGYPVLYAHNHIKGNSTFHAEHEAIRRYLIMLKKKCRKRC